MTVFAMGNSIGDLVSNVTMSRRGFPTMSIAACFAGPLMNILLTMGISGLLNWGNVPMLLKISLNLQIAYVGLIIMLAVIVMCVWTNNFVISRRLSWFILVLYAVVVIASSVADYLEI
jgi:sodium/potassium/calcium exchanger 6